ncbi:hypothetical protein LTR47_007701 [Exophiala xenobiotica]|nr:hypothetical protein LTR92_010208 [Exophiala xenobiotica]KAK5230285.1 hypothetical protein LTR47_007701 [Exophiala xenobiotica]KAK5241618.1 hypothetical protein LTS06_012002 [Exophiala xenobiotica]KAK5258569.1 hypothetical protein LTR40_007648 [Exophiala xenobiotica]KAK5321183.1 hypothetical protein LTR93_006425 [Exophiala xenobiotica]
MPKAEEGKWLSEVAPEDALLAEQAPVSCYNASSRAWTESGSSKILSTFISLSSKMWQVVIRKRDWKRAMKASNSRAQKPIPPTKLNAVTVASSMILHGLSLPHNPQNNPTSLGLEDMKQHGSVMG